MSEKYVPLKKMAEEYGLKAERLRAMCYRKDIRASKIGGEWFIKPSEMASFFERHSNKR